MFVRTIQRKSSHRNIAVQIVESYRNNKGQPRQRMVLMRLAEPGSSKRRAVARQRCVKVLDLGII